MATARSHGISVPRPALGGGVAKVSGHRGGARYTTRLPEIIAELPFRSEAIAVALCQLTAELAKPRAPEGPTGDLKDSLRGELLPRRQHAAVKAAWYWFFIEFGTVAGPHLPPHPFLLPAFEMAKQEIGKLAKAGMAHL